jgi:hypothetical protein
MRTLLACLCCIALWGCAWSPETKLEEATYQAFSAYDTAQSMQQAKRPDCYQESRFPTVNLLGRHPSASSQLEWGVARGAIHIGVTSLLEAEDAPVWVRRVWQGVTIGIEAGESWHNQTLGLRFSSATPPAYAPCLK